MAAFADYLDLRIAVAEQIGRDDLADLMPRFVLMAEDFLNKNLRTVNQITADTVTLTSGEGNLPSDFLEMIHVYGTNNLPLEASSIIDSKQSGSQYYTYAIKDGKLLIYGYSGDRDIEYYASLSTLTASVSTSNWLLADHPNVYLYATAYEAAKYLRDAEGASALSQLRDKELMDLAQSDFTYRFSNSSIRTRGPTP